MMKVEMSAITRSKPADVFLHLFESINSSVGSVAYPSFDQTQFQNLGGRKMSHIGIITYGKRPRSIVTAIPTCRRMNRGARIIRRNGRDLPGMSRSADPTISSRTVPIDIAASRPG